MCKKIVQDINDNKYGTSVNEITVFLPVLAGREDSTLGKDQLGLLKKELREAILSEL